MVIFNWTAEILVELGKNLFLFLKWLIRWDLRLLVFGLSVIFAPVVAIYLMWRELEKKEQNKGVILYIFVILFIHFFLWFVLKGGLSA